MALCKTADWIPGPARVHVTGILVRQQTGYRGLQGFMGMVLCETADWILRPVKVHGNGAL